MLAESLVDSSRITTESVLPLFIPISPLPCIFPFSLSVQPKELASRALKIAKYMRYYAWIVHLNNQAFLVETISQDLRVLAQTSSKNVQKGRVGLNIAGAVYRNVHEKILEVLF
jgi:hypothetical protein